MTTGSLSSSQAIQEAHRALRQGDRQTARQLAQQAAEQDPHLEDPWLILAASSEPEASIGYLKRALEINPGSSRARTGMHWAVKRLRQKRRAELRSPSHPATTSADNGAPLEAVSVVDTGHGIVVPPPASTFRRVFRYTAVKALMLLFTVVIGLYLFILVINLGGYVDKIFAASIEESIGGMIYQGWLRDTPEPERSQTIERTRWEMQEAMGLHQPFLARSFRLLLSGMTLEMGDSYIQTRAEFQAGTVRSIILSRLPYTLLLTGVTYVLVFFASILTALFLSRRQGGFLDRLSILLAPITSAPSWILGIILVAIFAAWLRVLPFPKYVPVEPPEYSLKYLAWFGQQMILPVMAIFIGAFFQGVYSWRAYFSIYASEDYVEMARANGLPNRLIERRHIIRPVLPYIITSFATTMILVWQSSIALELLFHWPGIGPLFLDSVRRMNTPMGLGVVVVFAYILVITMFILEIVYALVDPRVRLGAEGYSVRPVGQPVRRRLSSPIRGLFAPKAGLPAQRPASQKGPRSGLGRFLLGVPHSMRHWYSGIRLTLKELFRYRPARLGFLLIVLLFAVALYTVIAIPYNRAVALWRANTGDFVTSDWYHNPEFAPPAWVNLFRAQKLPETIAIDSKDGEIEKEIRKLSDASREIKIPFTFEFTAEAFPQDVILYISSTYQEKVPFISLVWRTPDGREIDLGGHTSSSQEAYYLTREKRLERKFRGKPVVEGLFGDPGAASPTPLKGRYQLEVNGYVFDAEADVDTEVVVYGLVDGLAGTDHSRRDLGVALLWGLPVALTFGLLGAIGSSLLAMSVAALGVWYSGWADEIIQRLTDLSMILPVLPIVILVYLLFSKSIWVILGVVVLLNTFSSGIKNYRAAFLQVRNAPYIEAARTYGTSNWRIIRKYLVPYIMPVLVPQIVILIPVFVFFEATLAFLGIFDPYIPTWGKVIFDALITGDLQRYPYWFLEPVALLMLTALAFSLLGLGLERVLNPRLRTD